MNNTHIEFIKNDIQNRKEKLLGPISNFAETYLMVVAKVDSGKKRTITYTTAQNKLKGFRRIKIDNDKN